MNRGILKGIALLITGAVVAAGAAMARADEMLQFIQPRQMNLASGISSGATVQAVWLADVSSTVVRARLADGTTVTAFTLAQMPRRDYFSRGLVENDGFRLVDLAPDGQRIFLSVHTPRSPWAAFYDINRQRLIFLRSWPNILPPLAWHPAGGMVAMVADLGESGWPAWLCVVNVETGVEILPRDSMRAVRDLGEPGDLAWTENGQVLAFTVQNTQNSANNGRWKLRLGTWRLSRAE